MMRVTRIRITNYRGIEALDQSVGPHGLIAQGRNGAGKTSVIKAIRSALAAQDVGADAIRQGADRAEILIDLDDVSVKRIITAKTSTVRVEKGGFEAKKPQTFLTELLGTSPLDPLDLFLSKPKERRAKILEALPVRVSPAQLQEWAPGCDVKGIDFSAHGLEVIERVRKQHYDARTSANAIVEQCERAAADAETAAKAKETAAPALTISISDANNAHTDAAKAFAALEALTAESSRAAARTESTRAKVNDLRFDAANRTAELGEQIPESATDATRREMAEAQDAFERARVAMKGTEAKHQALIALQERRIAEAREVAAIEAKAAELEQMIESVAVKAPSLQEREAAMAALAQAEKQLADAIAAEDARKLRERANGLAANATRAKEAAADIDAIVKCLANEAPAALLAASQGIPGLSIDGDDVLLDGKRLDALCGAEQMRFAVDIAKRLNAKSKILIVDGLERLDPEQMDQFVAHAVADDWQLLGTRVDRGEIVIEAIELGEVAT